MQMSDINIGGRVIIHTDVACIKCWKEHDMLTSISPFIHDDGFLYGEVSDIQYDGRVIVTVEDPSGNRHTRVYMYPDFEPDPALNKNHVDPRAVRKDD